MHPSISILGDMKSPDEQMAFLRELSCLYKKDKTNFCNQLESLVLKIIRDNGSEQLFSLYKNLCHIQVKNELQSFLLEMIMNAYLKGNNREILKYFLIQEPFGTNIYKSSKDEINSKSFKLFIDKSIQFNYAEFIELAKDFAICTNIDIGIILTEYFTKYEYRFDLTLDQLDNELKLNVLINSITSRLDNLVARFQAHIECNEDLKIYLEENLTDKNPVIKAFAQWHPWQWEQCKPLFKIIWKNEDSLKTTISDMIKFAKEKNSYYSLIFIAEGTSKKKIFKILLEHKNQSIIDTFISKFKNSPEIKPFVPFL